MSFAAPRRGSDRRSALKASPRSSRAVSMASTGLQSSASATRALAGRAEQTIVRGSRETLHRPSASSVASSRFCASSKKLLGQYCGSGRTSPAFTRGSYHEDQRNNTPRSCVNESQRFLHCRGALSNGHSDQQLSEKARSLLLGKMRLSDVRPDIYRLDLSQKSDLKFLYETQHRVDPELVPVKKRPTHEISRRMQQSNIFNTNSPPFCPATATITKRSDDGLGALARFVLSTETRAETPVRGRRRCASGTSRTNAELFCGGSNGTAGKSLLTQPKTGGKRMVSTHPTEKLGRDFLSLDVPGAEVVPVRGIRTLKAVQTFETTQPKLVLPPRKNSRFFNRGIRCHSASLDNDIFGVRNRREAMRERCCSVSARSNDPYGFYGGDEAAPHKSDQLSNKFTEPFCTEVCANTPFGDDGGLSICTPARTWQSPQGSSFVGSCSRRERTTPSVSVMRNFRNMRTPLGSRSDIGFVKSESVRRRPGHDTPDVTPTNTTSLITDENTNFKSSFLTPRFRTGKAMVPGYSFNKSNIVLGDVGLVASSARRLRRPQPESSRI